MTRNQIKWIKSVELIVERSDWTPPSPQFTAASMASAMLTTTSEKVCGMADSDLKRMKEMEAELSHLKRMYADIALENYALRDLI